MKKTIVLYKRLSDDLLGRLREQAEVIFVDTAQADGLAAARQLAGAHALLIHGPAGAGHFDMAVLLAQTLLCESVPAGTAAGGRA